MPNKTGYIKTYNPQKITKTRFETKWGEPAYKIAQREDVATTTIHMRIRNYGNPFQRKAKPSKWEDKYGKTIVEISKELRKIQNAQRIPFRFFKLLTVKKLI